jgi:2-polyprenyl-6-methoxyphenol hydroxylase-like FAD-dependent oxidoreductase
VASGNKRRALIIGGSVGGLCAAHTLRAIGWEAAVFERNAEALSDRGVGIGTHAVLFEAMRRIGLAIDDTVGVTTRSYVALDRNGETVCEMPQRRIMTAWSRLQSPLSQNLPPNLCHYGKAVERIDAAGPAALFADGSKIGADLIVAADGFRSTVRAQLLPQARPQYAGYIAWRAMAAERELPAAALLFDRFAFALPPGEMALSYPVAGRDGDTRPGHRAYNVVWYRPASPEQLSALCTDAQGRVHDVSIPPPLIRAEVVAEMTAAARGLLPPAMAETVARTEQPFFQPIYDLVSPRLVFGGVVLLGDAAFVARPHVGGGVTKAALDAIALADAIANADHDLETALVRYDRERQKFGNWIVSHGRDLGAGIGYGELAPAARADRVVRKHVESALTMGALTLAGACADDCSNSNAFR